MYSELLRKLEKIVNIPAYNLVGVTKDKLYYISNEEGTYDLWVSDHEGKNKTKIASRPLNSSGVRKDKNKIYFDLDVTKGKELNKIFVWEEGKIKEIDMNPMRIFTMAYYKDNMVYAGSTMEENVVYLVRKDEEQEKIFSTDKWVFVSDINEDFIIGSGTLHGNPKSMELFIYNLNKNEYKIYTPKEGTFNMASSIFNNKVLFTSNLKGEKGLFIYDIVANELHEPKFEGKDYLNYKFQDYLSYSFTEDGKIWFIGLQDYRGYAFLNGYKINHPEGTPTNLDVMNDEIFVSFSSLKEPFSIFKTKLNGEWRKILGSNLDEEIASSLGNVKIIKYKSFDGLEIPSIIYETNVPGKKNAIVYVHGGPWSHVGDFWSVSIVSLVVSGFNVIAPNFRGSTGYGEEFRSLDIGDPGGGDLKDVIYARNYAKENNLGEKIAIMGYSYGGFMSYLATVKEPELWDAAVAGAGIVDWEMMYELADAAFRHFDDILFANRKDLKKDRSAINFADKLKSPICIIHPQNDTRCPLKPVLKYIEKISEQGKTFEVHIIPDMGHIITSVEDIYKILFPAIVFLKKHLS
jgi:dipeptidyl aminopeptidase/acylaminoacyl peptidase